MMFFRKSTSRMDRRLWLLFDGASRIESSPSILVLLLKPALFHQQHSFVYVCTVIHSSKSLSLLVSCLLSLLEGSATVWIVVRFLVVLLWAVCVPKVHVFLLPCCVLSSHMVLCCSHFSNRSNRWFFQKLSYHTRTYSTPFKLQHTVSIFRGLIMKKICSRKQSNFIQYSPQLNKISF